MTKATRSTNTMQVSLGHLWKVEVNHNIHCLDINTSCEQVRADQVTASTVSEVMEDSVTVILTHSGVNVKA
jgi:hypothetical protein